MHVTQFEMVSVTLCENYMLESAVRYFYYVQLNRTSVPGEVLTAESVSLMTHVH